MTSKHPVSGKHGTCEPQTWHKLKVFFILAVQHKKKDIKICPIMGQDGSPIEHHCNASVMTRERIVRRCPPLLFTIPLIANLRYPAINGNSKILKWRYCTI